MKKSELQGVQTTRKIVVRISICAFIVSVLLVRPLYPDHTAVHFAIELTGAMLILMGVMIRLWCTLYIGGRKAGELITDGPYSISRNPLYVGSIVGAVGIGLQTGMVAAGLLCGMLCWLIFSRVVAKEETFLGLKFGEAFGAYRALAPRFGPRLSGYRDSGRHNTFAPDALVRCLRDAIPFLLFIPLSELIEHLQMAEQVPTFFTLL